MENWIPLKDKELKFAWKTFSREFKFKPSISLSRFSSTLSLHHI